MTVVFADAFTADADTNLNEWPSAGDPDYAYNVGSGSNLQVSSADDRCNLTQTNQLRSARIIESGMPTGDQQVSALVGVAGTVSSGEVRVRIQSSGDNGYVAKIELNRADGQRAVIYRVVSGSYTVLATGGPTGLAAGTHTLSLRAEGTNPVALTLVINGDEGSAVTFNDSNAARWETGAPGIGAYRNNGGHSIWIDNVEVDDLISAGASGGSQTGVNVNASGTGVKQARGGSSATTGVGTDGAGVSGRQNGANASVEMSTTGGGSAGGGVAHSGGSSTTVEVSAVGTGAKRASGGASSTANISITGDGTKHTFNGAGSSVTVTSIGGGLVGGGPPAGGSSTAVNVSVTGDGIKHTFSGSETSALVTSTGDGIKHAFGGEHTTVLVYSVGGASVVLIPVTDLVAVALIRTMPGIDPTKVGTTLPKNVNNWAEGFVQAVTAGGTPNIYVPLDGSVVAVSCWATNIGSGKPPWGKANQLAVVIQRDCLKHETYPRILDMTQFGNYTAAKVHSAYFVTEPRRIPSDEGSYARYDGDLQINWTPLGE